MADSEQVARVRRLLLARAERVTGGELVGATPLVLTIQDTTVAAWIEGGRLLCLESVVDVIADHDVPGFPWWRRAIRDVLGVSVSLRPSARDGHTEVVVAARRPLNNIDLDAVLETLLREVSQTRRMLQTGQARRGANEHSDETPPPPPPIVTEPTPAATPAPVRGRDGVIARLEALVGLAPVKKLIAGLAHLHDFDRERSRRGLPAVAPSPHLVFTGNPGTGKTTVARLVGQLYQAVGVLPRGHVVEATRADMVAAYLGQTALKTRALCERALGGVLFIDEAYTLTPAHRDQYGEEAVAELLTFMENHRGEFAVIVAGYPTEMQLFLAANPGLRSRFDEVIPFPDYSDRELLTIFELLVDQHRFTLTPAARAAVADAIGAMPRDRSFANARSVRNLFNNVVARHARGLAQRTFRSDVMNVIEAWAVPTLASTPPESAAGDHQHGGYL